jgi:hypothetical protein
VGAANVVEEEVPLMFELSDVPDGVAPCMTGCGRFWGNGRVPLPPLDIPFPFDSLTWGFPLPLEVPFPEYQGFPLSDFPLPLLLPLPLDFPFS